MHVGKITTEKGTYFAQKTQADWLILYSDPFTLIWLNYKKQKNL